MSSAKWRQFCPGRDVLTTSRVTSPAMEYPSKQTNFTCKLSNFWCTEGTAYHIGS